MKNGKCSCCLRSSSRNLEDAKENENFKLLTEESIIRKKIKIKQRKARLLDKNFEHTNLCEGRLVDGEIIYKINENHADTVEFSEKDLSLVEANQLPARLGDIPNNLLQKPLEELGMNKIFFIKKPI